MAYGLNDEEPCARAEEGADFGEGALRIGNLVNDGKSQDEVDLLIPVFKADGMVGAYVSLDSIGQAGPGGALFQGVDHSLLEVHGDDFAGFAYHLGHGQGEVAHAGSKIEGGHARFEVRGEDGLGILDETAKGADQEISYPPGAYVIIGHKVPPCVLVERTV